MTTSEKEGEKADTEYNNNDITRNILDDLLPTYQENKVCNICQKVQPLLVEEEIYYNQGRNKRVAYLCCSDFLRKNKNPCYDIYMEDLGLAGHPIVGGPGGWYEQTYHTIRGVFISCPIYPMATIMMMDEEKGRKLIIVDDNHNNNNKEKRRKNNQQQQQPNSFSSSSFFSSIIEKLKGRGKGRKRNKKGNKNNKNNNYDNSSSTGLKVESAVEIAYKLSPVVRQYLNAIDKTKVPLGVTSISNPRLHSIIWTMLYNEPLLEVVDKENLIFRWNRNANY
jgi:hypothetical protein